MKAWLLAALAATGSAWAEPVPPAAPPRAEAPPSKESSKSSFVSLDAEDDEEDSEAEEKEAQVEQQATGAGLSERELRRLARQERRRKRRAARLAHQGAAGAETPAALDKGGQVSMDKAKKMGDALKKSLADPSALGDALSGGGGPAGGSGEAADASAALEGGVKRSLPDPTRPKTAEDLLAAARSGYAESFKDLGMKVGQDGSGKPSIVRTDGAPASEADLQTLAERIGSEPRALLRRPDFFKVVSREKFTDLKKDYKATQELGEGVFKHVNLREERDFVWSRSCQALAGGCNRYASASSYQGGHDVPPEDLRSFWNAQHGEPAAAQPGEVAKVDASGVRGRLKSVLSAIRSAFDGNSTKGGSGTGAPSAPAVAGGGWDFQPGQVAETTEAQDKRLGRVGGAGEVQSASMVENVPQKARLPVLGAGLLGALGLLLVLRRRAS